METVQSLADGGTVTAVREAPPIGGGTGDDEVTDAIIRASRALVGIAVRSLTASDEEVTLPQYRTLVTLTYGGGRRLRQAPAAQRASELIPKL